MLRLLQLWITIAVLVLAPLFFGSVELFWIATWTIVLSIGTVCGLSFSMETSQIRILIVFCLICSVYGAVSIVQITPCVFNGMNDEIWRKSRDILSLNVMPRISSRAQIPTLAIGHVLLFATSFINGFCACTSRDSTDKLFRFSRFSIVVLRDLWLRCLLADAKLSVVV